MAAVSSAADSSIWWGFVVKELQNAFKWHGVNTLTPVISTFDLDIGMKDTSFVICTLSDDVSHFLKYLEYFERYVLSGHKYPRTEKENADEPKPISRRWLIT